MNEHLKYMKLSEDGSVEVETKAGLKAKINKDGNASTNLDVANVKSVVVNILDLDTYVIKEDEAGKLHSITLKTGDKADILVNPEGQLIRMASQGKIQISHDMTELTVG